MDPKDYLLQINSYGMYVGYFTKPQSDVRKAGNKLAGDTGMHIHEAEAVARAMRAMDRDAHGGDGRMVD